ncbi:acyl carrier protein [Streptomyces sp. DSM 15324]|uniref:acyl carrier protein n=1 Tax=Streptomyces sp. DSM 15324 TaxID=1739111 RepID=UPI000746A467|nr:acyl carrier protein [Streptomyces sp. DSM 15324]KUO12926.1 curamycin polyketide synthase [Streptomyces sp. DSM 15324]
MSDRITLDELAGLMKKAAGITVTPEQLKEHADGEFGELGIDSLGLLGIVGELENRFGAPLDLDMEACRTPRQFVDRVNSALPAGA